ncbi:DUF167 domain-containing protein [Candidatus Sumerlaeota bacterium]|nr:DUF167 domain-containing protein [Candidatus Sumerlaeota bacterium]
MAFDEKGEVSFRLTVRVTPRSSKTSLTGNAETGFKLKVNSPPVEGAANKECIRFLAKIFGAPKSAVTLIKGAKSRDKAFEIVGISPKDAKSVLKNIPQ